MGIGPPCGWGCLVKASVQPSTEPFSGLLRFGLGYSSFVRVINVTAVSTIAIAVSLITPTVLTDAAAHADLSGYRRCVGKITEPVSEPDPQNLQLVGVIKQDLNSGVAPEAEAQKVTQMGFDAQLANGIVQCVIEEHP
jgi:hypothetical protein